MSEKQNKIVWHLGYHGPRSVELVMGISTKALVLFHGSPELVDMKDLYESRQKCFQVAAAAENKEAAEHSRRAADYLEHASKVDGETEGSPE
jgi:hypothetical protein